MEMYNDMQRSFLFYNCWIILNKITLLIFEIIHASFGEGVHIALHITVGRYVGLP